MQARPITAISTKTSSDIKYNISEVLEGQRVSCGKFKGEALRIKKESEIEKSEELQNKVIIIDEFYPEIIYHVDKVGALVVAKGGKLSHAAIVARERNIVCVTGLENEIDKIKNDMIVCVDADNGKVIICNE